MYSTSHSIGTTVLQRNLFVLKIIVLLYILKNIVLQVWHTVSTYSNISNQSSDSVQMNDRINHHWTSSSLIVCSFQATINQYNFSLVHCTHMLIVNKHPCFCQDFQKPEVEMHLVPVSFNSTSAGQAASCCSKFPISIKHSQQWIQTLLVERIHFRPERREAARILRSGVSKKSCTAWTPVKTNNSSNKWVHSIENDCLSQGLTNWKAFRFIWWSVWNLFVWMPWSSSWRWFRNQPAPAKVILHHVRIRQSPAQTFLSHPVASSTSLKDWSSAWPSAWWHSFKGLKWHFCGTAFRSGLF